MNKLGMWGTSYLICQVSRFDPFTHSHSLFRFKTNSQIKTCPDFRLTSNCVFEKCERNEDLWGGGLPTFPTNPVLGDCFTWDIFSISLSLETGNWVNPCLFKGITSFFTSFSRHSTIFRASEHCTGSSNHPVSCLDLPSPVLPPRIFQNSISK